MVGLTPRQMRRKPIGTEHLLDIKPITPTQEEVFDAWQKKKTYSYMVALEQENHS